MVHIGIVLNVLGSSIVKCYNGVWLWWWWFVIWWDEMVLKKSLLMLNDQIKLASFFHYFCYIFIINCIVLVVLTSSHGQQYNPERKKNRNHSICVCVCVLNVQSIDRYVSHTPNIGVNLAICHVFFWILINQKELENEIDTVLSL